MHLFEPTKSCFEELKKKFLNIQNIFLNNFGISNIQGNSIIYYDKEKSGLASLYKREINKEMDIKENILLKRMENYIEEKKIKYIDFIKIDVEGHELKVLESFGKYLSFDFINYIQFEYGEANLDSHTTLRELYKLLESNGFKIAKIMQNGLEIRDYKSYMENFQYANYVAISRKVLNL